MTSRIAATELLVSVLDEGHALEDALSHTPAYRALQGRDRAFARAIATAALRRLGGLDAIITSFLERPLPDSAAHARALLRIGAAQALILETPPHAAVGETVTAANALRGGRGFAKLINAVLRKVVRDGPALLAAQPPGADLPAWLYTRWRAAYGEHAAAIANALHTEPPLDLTAKADASDWTTPLFADLTPTGSLRVTDPQRAVDELPGFAEGAWWVQDAAAAIPTRLLGDVRGKRVLDLCAAPGGKTLQLAAAGAHVTALDKSAERLTRVEENLARTKLDADIVCADALDWRPKQRFDAILLDAPCTATGTLRRHPDVAWLRRPTDIRALSELQSKMLDAACAMLKPDGVLVYAVCSLEPEEGPGVIAQALSRGWRRTPLSAADASGIGPFLTPDGDLRIHPGHWPEIGGLDGFFAARLQRSEA